MFSPGTPFIRQINLFEKGDGVPALNKEVF